MFFLFYEKSGGVDGYIFVEVFFFLVNEIEVIIDFVKYLYKRVNWVNVFIKIFVMFECFEFIK